MIHRRLLVDDRRGVGEPLNETEKNGTIGLTQKMRHYLVFSSLSETRDRRLQYNLDTFPIIVLANNSLPEFLRVPQQNETSLNQNTIPMQHGLKIYLRDLGDDNYLLRLMNNDVSETKSFTMKYDYEELSMTAVMTKNEMEVNRLKWVPEESQKMKSPAAPAPTINLEANSEGTQFELGIYYDIYKKVSIF
jgi:hypothetical protein